jgi:isopentenyl-diphosphate delta-isomerase
MNRKDDHIQLALKQEEEANDFDQIRTKHHAFPELNLASVNPEIHLFDQVFPLPFYINAMTGGSDQAAIINSRLAQLAKHFRLPIATGSMSTAIKHPSLSKTFTVIRDIYPDGFIIANLGAGQTITQAKQAIEMIRASALQIHVNAVQEAVMPEGDRDFQHWLGKIKTIREGIQQPLIVKEVGFGMSRKTLIQLQKIGVSYVDVAGRGGTNFAVIENHRRQTPYASLNHWGLSTVESLLEVEGITNMTVFASGGIRQPLDAIKALALGAKAVGLSGYFLKLVTQFDHDEAVKQFQLFIDEFKTLMGILGQTHIADLTKIDLIFSPSLLAYKQQLNENRHS